MEYFVQNLREMSFSKEKMFDIYLRPELQNAGVFTFIQTKPEQVNLAQFEVFAVKGKFTLFFHFTNNDFLTRCIDAICSAFCEYLDSGTIYFLLAP